MFISNDAFGPGSRERSWLGSICRHMTGTGATLEHSVIAICRVVSPTFTLYVAIEGGLNPGYNMYVISPSSGEHNIEIHYTHVFDRRLLQYEREIHRREHYPASSLLQLLLSVFNWRYFGLAAQSDPLEPAWVIFNGIPRPTLHRLMSSY